MKKLRILLIAAGVFLLCASILAAEAPQKMRFSYQYRPGATYRIRTDMNNLMSIEIKGGEMEAEAALAAMLQNIKSLIGMDMEQKFGSPDKDGNLPFDARVVDYTMKTYAGGMEIPMPPEKEKSMKDKMMEIRWSGKMTKNGKVVDFNSAEMEKMLGDSAKEITDVIMSFPEFPEKDISLGEDFTYSIERPIRLGGGADALSADVKIVYQYHLKDMREGNANFDIKCDYQMAGNSETTGNLSVKGTGTGYGAYDIEKHFFTKIHLDNDYSLITAMPSEKKAEAGGKEAEPSQMIMKIKQDVTTTMTMAQ